MTAEIVILNKSAVALATDSAVTISAGSKEEKIYDSADKLFELSFNNPIGIMIYNGMNIMEVPLQILIKKYRNHNQSFDTVELAANDFLQFLVQFSVDSPDSVKSRNLSSLSLPLMSQINKRIFNALEKIIKTKTPPSDMLAFFQRNARKNIEAFRRVLEKMPDATLIPPWRYSV